MLPIESSDCLTAMLIGLHYAKPRFSIANFFNEIVDSVSDLPNFRIQSFGHHELVFGVGKLKGTLNQNALIINSPVIVGNDLHKHVVRKSRPGEDDSFLLPIGIYDSRFDLQLGIESQKEGTKEFRKNFLEEVAELIRVVDKIIQGGLPAFRFIGLVEYYVIPLAVVRWDVLDRFTREADIPGGVNTEKISVNRYYFQENEETDERCFIFKLIRPNDHNRPEMTVAGANLDFQSIPEKPKTIAEYGGPRAMVVSLAAGIEQMIRHSGFLKFLPRS